MLLVRCWQQLLGDVMTCSFDLKMQWFKDHAMTKWVSPFFLSCLVFSTVIGRGRTRHEGVWFFLPIARSKMSEGLHWSQISIYCQNLAKRGSHWLHGLLMLCFRNWILEGGFNIDVVGCPLEWARIFITGDSFGSSSVGSHNFTMWFVKWDWCVLAKFF